MLLTPNNLPETIADIADLDDILCRPSQALIDDLTKVDGDIMILGVAGKMGPTLAGLAKAALPHRRVIGVARFSDASVKTWLQARRVETINSDLLDESAFWHGPHSGCFTGFFCRTGKAKQWKIKAAESEFET